MKKLAVLGVLLGVLFGFAASAKAEGIEAGTQLVSGYLGGSAPLQDAGLDDLYYRDGGVYIFHLNDLDWGDAGVTFGASYLYFLNDYFGLGGEISGTVFGEAEYDTYSPFGHSTFKSSMSTFNAMAVGRVNVNPQSRVRVYFPFGLGLTSAKGEIKLDSPMGNDSTDGTTTSIGYFIGAGIETDLGESNWVLGGEIRYQGFQFDTAKYDMDGISGKENYSYLSFMAKVGYKF